MELNPYFAQALLTTGTHCSAIINLLLFIYLFTYFVFSDENWLTKLIRRADKIHGGKGEEFRVVGEKKSGRKKSGGILRGERKERCGETRGMGERRQVSHCPSLSIFYENQNTSVYLIFVRMI